MLGTAALADCGLTGDAAGALAEEPSVTAEGLAALLREGVVLTCETVAAAALGEVEPDAGCIAGADDCVTVLERGLTTAA